MLAQIPLDSDLAETLEELARQQGLSLEQIADKVVRQYVRQARREKIRVEAEHYRALYASLVPSYLDEHVAIHNGQLVDHDRDAEALVHRVRERFGHTAVLFTQVGKQPIPEFVARRQQARTRVAPAVLDAP
jgi:hypothetical protein